MEAPDDADLVRSMLQHEGTTMIMFPAALTGFLPSEALIPVFCSVTCHGPYKAGTFGW